MKTKYRVKYLAKFETVIEVGAGESPHDVVADIDVPENDESKYVADSFEPLLVEELPADG